MSCILLLVVPGAAAGGATWTGTADRISVHAGGLEGQLDVLAWRVPTTSSEAAGIAPTFSLDARRITVEVDERSEGPAMAGIGTVEEPTSRTYTIHNASSSGQPVGTAGDAAGAFDLAILAFEDRERPRLSAVHDGATTAPATPYEMADRVGTGRSTKGPVGPVFAMEMEGADSYLVTGDFRVALWAFEWTATSDEGDTTERTGAQRDTVAPNPLPGSPQASGHRSQAYLLVEGGRLTLTGLPSHHVILHSRLIDLSVESAALTSATTAGPGAPDTADPIRSLRLGGQLALQISADPEHPSGIAFQAAGIESANADGEPLNLTVRSQGRWSRWWPYALVGGLFVGAPAGVGGAQAVRHNVQSGRMTDLETLSKSRDWDGVIEVARGIPSGSPYAQDAAWLALMARANRGEWDVVEQLTLRRSWSDALAPLVLCTRGMALAHLGRAQEAALLLQEATTVAPHLIDRIDADPVARAAYTRRPRGTLRGAPN